MTVDTATQSPLKALIIVHKKNARVTVVGRSFTTMALPLCPCPLAPT